MPSFLSRGVSLHYLDDGAGVPVVLIHGLGNSGRDWEFQLDALLAAGYRVIRPDLPGFGQSGKPDHGYSPVDMAGDLQRLLQHLEVDKAHLVGYSMGGAVAYQLAIEEPERWLSLGIISSVPCFVPQRLYDHWQFWQRHVLSRVLGMRKLAEMVSERLFPTRPDLAALMLPRYADNDREVYGHVLAALSGWDVRNHLPRIQCPVLILAAELDYFRLEDVQQGMENLPQAELRVIAGTRHGLPIEAPDVVSEALIGLFRASDVRPEAA